MALAGRPMALAALAGGSFAASVVTSRSLFPLYSVNRDDSVYVAMARLIKHGHVTLPAAGQELFRPWASGVVGDRIVLKYTPPWPSVLAAADAVTGSTVVGLGLTAAATVVAMAVLAGEVLRDRPAGVVAGVLLALSPLFLFQSGTYLPYVFQLGLGLCFAALLLTGMRRRSSVRVVAAGGVFGVAAFARPFDAVLFAAPFVLFALIDARRHPGGDAVGRWTWLGTAARLAAGALPLLVLSLVYNAVVMGSPFRLPYTVTGPQDGFGFGRRGVFPGSTVSFAPRDGVTGLLANLQSAPGWTFGGVVLVALAVVGLARTTGAARWAVAALAVVFPLGYLAFWGPYALSELWEGVESLGPFYYLPVLVPLATFAAVPLLALWRGGTVRARALGAVVVTALVVLTAVAVPAKVAVNASIRNDYRAVQHFVTDHRLGTAVLLLPRRGDLGFISSSPFLENSASLRQPVLYAEDRGAQDFTLVDRYPDRPLYRLSQDLPPGKTTGGRLTLDRLRLDAGPAVTVRLRMTNPTDRTVAVAYLTDGHTLWSQQLDLASTRGRTYDVSWTVAAPGSADLPAEWTARLPAGPGTGVLAAGLELRAPGTAPGTPGRRWERRIAYRLVDGAARVELLQPGQAWACDDVPGADWVEAAADNPVGEIGQDDGSPEASTSPR
jgi:hypothetical protein